TVNEEKGSTKKITLKKKKVGWLILCVNIGAHCVLASLLFFRKYPIVGQFLCNSDAAHDSSQRSPSCAQVIQISRFLLAQSTPALIQILPYNIVHFSQNHKDLPDNDQPLADG